MNQNPFDMEMRNPWKERGSIPYPKMIRVLPIAFVYVLALMTLVFFGIEQFALIAFLGMSIGAIYVIRFPRILIPILVISLLPITFTFSFGVSALILGTLMSTACGAILITATPRAWRMLLVPAVAWVAVYAITRDAALACMTLVTLPASILLSVGTLTGQRRTTAVCYTVVGLLLSVVALIAVYFYATYGTLTADVIKQHLDSSREWMTDSVIGVWESMNAELSESAQGGFSAEMQGVMSREAVAEVVDGLFGILPALVIVICSILAYEAQSILCSAYFTLGMKRMLTPQSLTFTMSTASAILYLTAFLISLFVPADGVFGMALQNFTLILTPGLFLVGWAAAMFRFRASKGFSKVLYIVTFVLLVMFGISMLFSVMAFFGSISVILAALGVRMMQKMKDSVDMGGGMRGFGANADAETSDEPSEEEDDGEEEAEEDEEDDSQSREP